MMAGDLFVGQAFLDRHHDSGILDLGPLLGGPLGNFGGPGAPPATRAKSIEANRFMPTGL
jgi:hypothetical protein